jgi:hypothetical protein
MSTQTKTKSKRIRLSKKSGTLTQFERQVERDFHDRAAETT